MFRAGGFFPELPMAPPGATMAAAVAVSLLTPCPQEVPHASYRALGALATTPSLVCLRLHPPRLPPLCRVDHRPRPQRRGTHHHPVSPRPGPRRGLEGPGGL